MISLFSLNFPSISNTDWCWNVLSEISLMPFFLIRGTLGLRYLSPWRTDISLLELNASARLSMFHHGREAEWYKCVLTSLVAEFPEQSERNILAHPHVYTEALAIKLFSSSPSPAPSALKLRTSISTVILDLCHFDAIGDYLWDSRR